MLNQKWIVNVSCLLLLWLLPIEAAQATPLAPAQIIAVDWHEGDKKLSGAGRSYSYAAAHLSWPEQQMGAWVDSNMVFLGKQAFAKQQINGSQQGQSVTWQVTELVRRIVNSDHQAIDLLLHGQESKGNSVFHSKESANNKAPKLIITTSTGNTIESSAAMDTYLDSSTFRSLGHSKNLKAGRQNVVLLQFNKPNLTADETIVSAELQLVLKKQYGSGDLGVFWLAQQRHKPAKLAEFTTKQIIFKEEFSDSNWAANWSSLDRRSLAEQAKAPQRTDNTALKVEFNPAQNTALNLVLLLKSIQAEEPEALYFQYDLYLNDNWLATKGGGKFPGLAGTYNRAGWGGRSADGKNGWSARGQFGDTIESDDKFNNSTPLGFYAYYPDNGQNHGAALYWDTGSNPIKPGKWYRLTQYVKLNTPVSKTVY
ncbi:hypothetical protein [Arsukibacterium sp.]|uniref:hypothetical protein n=1 Tax=Arsukibacterium sp. TaxID=1977258 RepID=UPI001BD51038|nr:hypothetical protein [Arsukibacterium sp.]